MKHHICHINTTFNHQAGSARRTHAILRRLVERDYQVTLIVGRDFNPHPAWDFSGIRVVQEKTLAKYVDIKNDVRSLLNLTVLLRKLRPDLVHTHLAKAGFVGRVAAKLARVPIVVHTVHGPTFAESMGTSKNSVYMVLEWLASRFADHFVFVGRELADYYVRKGIVPAHRITVIHTGRFSLNDNECEVSCHDLEALRASLCTDPSSFVMISVGRVVPSKQQEHCIQALAALRRKNIRAELLIAGEALLPEEQYYRSLLLEVAQALGVSEYIHFLGFCDNILDAMMASDVLVLTSKYEGLPNVAVEAALVGCPIVSYEVMGVGEVAGDATAAVLVPCNDVEAMVQALADLALNPEKSNGDSAQNKLRLQRFSIEHMLDSKLSFYETLCAAKGNACDCRAGKHRFSILKHT